jgi:DNA-binding NtrC family response regulator
MNVRTDVTGKKVLLVEDEYFIADDMARYFEQSGMTVVGPAARVKDALHLIAGTPDLDGAVLDINLQDESVFAVADALSRRNVPFIFATGYDAAVIPSNYGQIKRCEKPVDPAKVAATLFS